MKRDLEFLYEIGALRLIPRQWQRFHLPGVQNLTEHHYRVIWIALMIAAREGKADTAKIIKMALVHDVAESRTGDVDYLARQYVTRDEEAGMQHILADTSLEKEFLALWEEYEQRLSLEAQIVKDADNLDVDLELREQGSKGHSLEKEWRHTRDAIASERFYTKTARKLYADIKASNPHDWHIKSPHNRLHGGDWKKTEPKDTKDNS